jgi:hypothetical protein
MAAQKSKTLTSFILDRNKKQSAEFCAPGSQLARRLYRAQHPSEIIALKCMDGRLNLSLVTNTPPGIIKPYRNIGGRFDLGWPFFGRLVLEDVEYGVSKGRPTIVLSTYHFSKGDAHRGCAGYQYDTEAARAGATKLAEQFARAFGQGRTAVFPLVVGMETDECGLVFHGAGKRVFDVALNAEASIEDVRTELARLYPDLPEQIVADLVPLIAGNQAYVRELRTQRRPVVDMEHKENIIAVGRGLDWLHLPNGAFIIGPYDPAWESAVEVAATIVLNNMKEKRVREQDGALLLVTAPFRSVGADQGVAAEKALFLARESERVLRERVPAIVKKLNVLVGTVDYNTRLFTVLKKA